MESKEPPKFVGFSPINGGRIGERNPKHYFSEGILKTGAISSKAHGEEGVILLEGTHG